MSRFIFLIVLLPALAAGCAQYDGSGAENPQAMQSGAVPSLDDDDVYLESEAVQIVIADPLEPWNRMWYHFNDGFLQYGARPLYRGYEYVTPSFFRTGVKNAFNNLLFPVRFVNCLLQGKGMAAGVEFSSFVLNSTMGVGGLIDVAKDKEKVVTPDVEDTGQTLGVWGMGEGFYLVWPLLGPSNVRDSFGKVGDHFLDPITYLEPWELSLGLSVGRAFNGMDEILDFYDDFKGMTVEPYSAMRDSYTQYRRAKIAK